jgi:endonuclease/exonuclease/phosphatase family metal-dependent hydrolase
MNVLSYNIQAGIGAQKFSDYILKGHRQFIDVKAKRHNLSRIAEFIAQFDIVCLQEVDLGGRRAGFTSQVDILRKESGLEFSATQINRQVGKTSIHGNIILSRKPIEAVEDHKLPGRIPGRGKLMARVDGLCIVNTHLSLNAAAQTAQLRYIEDVVKAETSPLLVLGDFNCAPQAHHLEKFAEGTGLKLLTNTDHKTYPAWKPKHAYDHILGSKRFKRAKPKVHDVTLSDHRPISVSI